MAEYQAVATGSVRMRWREPYIGGGVNTVAGAHPSGCYRGFWIEETTPPSTSIVLTTTSPEGHGIGVDLDSCAIVADNGEGGYALAVREAADVTLSLAPFFGVPLPGVTEFWIGLVLTYTESASTVANYVISLTDPRLDPLTPHAIIIGGLIVGAGATDVTLRGGTANAVAVYTERTLPTPTAREAMTDYVSGDVPFGLMAGTDRWLLPTADQKDAMTAANSPSGTNPFATEANTTDKVIAEPTVVTMTLAAGITYVDIAASYGPFYLGIESGYMAVRKFVDVRPHGSQLALRMYSGDQSNGVSSISRIGTSTTIVPPTDTDASGYYTGGIRVNLLYAVSQTVSTSIDVGYLRKRTVGTLNDTPTYAIPNVAIVKHDHADNILCRKNEDVNIGMPLYADATLTTHLTALWQKVRGSNYLTDGDKDVASKLYAYSQAHPYNESSQYTLPAVAYQRVLSYGYDYNGTGLRYILASITDGGLQKIGRYIVTGRTVYASGSAIDVTTRAAAAAALQSPPVSIASANWRIAGCASDGTNIYVRLYGESGAFGYHYLDAYNITTGVAIWANPVYIVGTPSDVIVYANYTAVFNTLHVIMATSTLVAVNVPWQNILDGGAAARGIYLYSIVDGAFVRAGHGNGEEYVPDSPHTDARCSGPMVSDGTYLYFSVNCYADATAMMQHGIGHLLITDPTLDPPRTGAKFAQINSNQLLSSTLVNPIRSLVFDGTFVWVNMRFGLYAVDPLSLITEPVLYFTDDSEFFEFGPAIFDGKNLWFCCLRSPYAEGVGNTTIDRLCHLVKFNPSAIDATETALLEFGYFKDYVLQCPKWSLFKQAMAIGFYRTDLEDQIAFGPLLYDGDTVYWTQSNIDEDGSFTESATTSRTMQRLSNIHGV